MNFTASCATRGSSADVTVPKFAAPATAFGAPKFGVFSRLKISPRSSIARGPAIRIRRVSATSTSRYDGPRTGFRDAVPSVNGPAGTKAAVLNQWPGVRWSAGNVGSPTRFGRWVPNPANALLFVVCVTATGIPDCSVTTALTFQSLTTAPRAPCAWRARPDPIGRSQTTEAARTCGMSPFEYSRAVVRFEMSGALTFATERL